jgi:hypothetical protein
VANYWKEPLDPARHRDHFHPGSALPRTTERRGTGFIDFVQFASVDQLRAWRVHLHVLSA